MAHRGITALLLASLAATSAAPEPENPALRERAGVDWPTFLGPTGDGVSPETGIRTDWSRGLPLVWQKEVGEGYSMGSVASGRFFLFDRVGQEARLRALDAGNGEVLWSTTYPSRYEDLYGYSTGPRASPVVDGDRVYTFGVEGHLRCHRAGDGELLWDVDTSTRFGVVQNFFGVGTTPVVEKDVVIVMIGGSPPGSPAMSTGAVQGNGTGIVAFDKTTGGVRWTLSEELASYSTPRVATMGGRRRGFAFTRGGLLGFDPARGTQDFFFPWRSRTLESVNAATPVIVGDTVFVSETYGPGSVLLKVPPTGDPEVLWRDSRRNQSLQAHWNTPIHYDGHLYASSGRGSGNAELRCIDFRSGKVSWVQPGLGRSTLLLVDGHIVVLTEYGRLLLVRPNPERYQLLGELDLEDDAGRKLLRHPAWNPPILAHGLLYVRGKDRLVALELIPRSL